MNHGKTIFSQVVSYIPESKFRRLVAKYGGDSGSRTFSCWDHLLCMIFAQLTYRESLRDIEACLRSLGPKLYHMGIRGNISRTNIARANKNRDWRIYRDLAQHLIGIARKLYSEESFLGELDSAIYAFDSTAIDLSFSLFPWSRSVGGRHGSQRRILKLHTLLDIRTNIPTFIHISDGKVHDVRALDHLIIEPLATYVLDRGYFDLKRLYRITKSSGFFVTRSKANIRYRRIYSNTPHKEHGIMCDQIVTFVSEYAKSNYPDKLRRIRFFDSDTQKYLIFVTNNFQWPAETVASLYKARWQIETFFKWIKQHLRIKRFFGNNENAVKTQIWVAVATYVLVAIIKKKLDLSQSLYTILQVLSVSNFEKTPILSVFNNRIDNDIDYQPHNQLKLL